jgi:hypothetical protein
MKIKNNMINNYKSITVKYVEPSEITQLDIDGFKSNTSESIPFMIHPTKRMIYVAGLVFVNPTIKDVRNQIVYWELDSNKPKYRKTVRYSYILVQTDNLGDVEFKSDIEGWKDVNQLMEDTGLAETVLVQRLIDAIDGIDITNPIRRYENRLYSEKVDRNKRVMVQSPKGETLFMKYKKAIPLINQGYKLI